MDRPDHFAITIVAVLCLMTMLVGPACVVRAEILQEAIDIPPQRELFYRLEAGRGPHLRLSVSVNNWVPVDVYIMDMEDKDRFLQDGALSYLAEFSTVGTLDFTIEGDLDDTRDWWVIVMNNDTISSSSVEVQYEYSSNFPSYLLYPVIVSAALAITYFVWRKARR